MIFKRYALSLLTVLLVFKCWAGPGDSTASVQAAEDELAGTIAFLDSADKTMPYQTGAVKLRQFANLNVPAGYKFLPEQQTQWLVQKVWGNPADPDIMGMLVRDDYKLSTLDAWAFIVSYDESGYVKDEDADDINYDDLLKEIQSSETETNKERLTAGFPKLHFVNWASKPFYDKENKVLHWAKEIQFGDSKETTLNYDVRILGRKGVLSMNAVGNMSQLNDIKTHIPEILHAAAFSEGYQYKDFDPGIDKVAAYTVGGLIAGKLLAKAGIIALLLKNIKLILLAFFGGFAAFRKKIAGLFRRRKNDDITPGPEALQPAYAQTAPASEPTNPNDNNDTSSHEPQS